MAIPYADLVAILRLEDGELRAGLSRAEGNLRQFAGTAQQTVDRITFREVSQSVKGFGTIARATINTLTSLSFVAEGMTGTFGKLTTATLALGAAMNVLSGAGLLGLVRGIGAAITPLAAAIAGITALIALFAATIAATIEPRLLMFLTNWWEGTKKAEEATASLVKRLKEQQAEQRKLSDATRMTELRRPALEARQKMADAEKTLPELRQQLKSAAEPQPFGVLDSSEDFIGPLDAIQEAASLRARIAFEEDRRQQAIARTANERAETAKREADAQSEIKRSMEEELDLSEHLARNEATRYLNDIYHARALRQSLMISAGASNPSDFEPNAGIRSLMRIDEDARRQLENQSGGGFGIRHGQAAASRFDQGIPFVLGDFSSEQKKTTRTLESILREDKRMVQILEGFQKGQVPDAFTSGLR